MKTVILLDREHADAAPKILGLQIRIRSGGVRPPLFVHGASILRRQLRLGHDTVVAVPEDELDVAELTRVCGEHGYRVQRMLLTDIVPVRPAAPVEEVVPEPRPPVAEAAPEPAAAVTPIEPEPVQVSEPVVELTPEPAPEPEPTPEPAPEPKRTRTRKKKSTAPEPEPEPEPITKRGTRVKPTRKAKATTETTSGTDGPGTVDTTTRKRRKKKATPASA
jgi:hypothetical protein